MINPQKRTKAQQAKFERETIITWNELEDEATYMTASPKEWLKMEKLGIEPFRQTNYDRHYKAPKAWFEPKKPGKPRGRSINEIAKPRVAKIHAL
jgi:hypothetical protein